MLVKRSSQAALDRDSSSDEHPIYPKEEDPLWPT